MLIALQIRINDLNSLKLRSSLSDFFVLIRRSGNWSIKEAIYLFIDLFDRYIDFSLSY